MCNDNDTREIQDRIIARERVRADLGRIDRGGLTMNNDDERDYAEEEYNRRTMIEEQESELADEQVVEDLFVCPDCGWTAEDGLGRLEPCYEQADGGTGDDFVRSDEFLNRDEIRTGCRSCGMIFATNDTLMDHVKAAHW